jgi:hypothetical protein
MPQAGGHMSEILSLMIWPILACIVLTGIHVYFGAHVINVA